jgi:hypothetical protein
VKTIQLREYTIRPGELETFATAWAKGVRPLRQKMGFVIEGAWKIPTEGKFIWVVSYDGADGWDAANAAYYDSPGRKALDPDPASFIVERRTVLIDQV